MNPSDPRGDLFELLESSVRDGVFPGCVALVWRAGVVLYHEAHGELASHPGVSVTGRRVERDTIYDLASLTKILSTTTLAALAVGDGSVALETPVPEPWSQACPGATLADLLEHCSGLAAHREYFAEVQPFDADAVVAQVVQTPAEYPLRERAVYSDLGFIILGAWLERLHDRPLREVFRDRIAYPLGLVGEDPTALDYREINRLGLPFVHERYIAPTEVYDPGLFAGGPPSYLPVRDNRLCAHGEVHDDNAYVMGGTAGHAGLFGTAQAVFDVGRAWWEASLPGLDATVRDRFWAPSAVPGSTRRFGWDGPSPDGSGSCGDALSHDAVGHTGYTGTSLWMGRAADGDPRICVLLSNRVHPTRENDGIRALRQRFHRAAVRL